MCEKWLYFQTIRFIAQGDTSAPPSQAKLNVRLCPACHSHVRLSHPLVESHRFLSKNPLQGTTDQLHHSNTNGVPSPPLKSPVSAITTTPVHGFLRGIQMEWNHSAHETSCRNSPIAGIQPGAPQRQCRDSSSPQAAWLPPFVHRR